jgi:serine/threonine protein kinase
VLRDLKLENILLDSLEPSNFSIKIADFDSMARKIPDGEKEDLICGTPIYMAPEVIKGLQYECEVDIWNTGVIAYILLSGDALFKGKTKMALQAKIINKDITMNDSAWVNISNEAKDFIKEALNRNQQERWTAQ